MNTQIKQDTARVTISGELLKKARFYKSMDMESSLGAAATEAYTVEQLARESLMEEVVDLRNKLKDVEKAIPDEFFMNPDFKGPLSKRIECMARQLEGSRKSAEKERVELHDALHSKDYWENEAIVMKADNKIMRGEVEALCDELSALNKSRVQLKDGWDCCWESRGRATCLMYISIGALFVGAVLAWIP